MIHLQSPVNNWLEAVDRLQAGAVIKAVDNVQALSEAKSRKGSIRTCLRHHYDSNQVFGGTAAENEQRARDFLETFIDDTFTVHSWAIDYVEEWNEYIASSHNAQEKAERITWARAVAKVWAQEYRTQYPHIRLVLANCAVGNDISWEYAQIAEQYDCVIGYHAYDHWISGNRDWGSWPFHAGRWATMDLNFRSLGYTVDWLFTESGPYSSVVGGWKSPDCMGGDRERYVDAIAWFIDNITATSAFLEGRVLGFCLFTTGSMGSWPFFETVQPELNMLAEMTAVRWVEIDPSPIYEVYGVDVSHWQGDMDWTVCRVSAGNSFVAVKVTEGTTGVDELGAINLSGARNEGLYRAGYHFYRADLSPMTQAIHFCNHLPPSVYPVLDLEDVPGVIFSGLSDKLTDAKSGNTNDHHMGEYYHLSDRVPKIDAAPDDLSSSLRVNVKIWLDEVEAQTGKKPIIYTSPGYWNSYMAGVSWAGNYPLWVAHWTSNPTPVLPSGWVDWTMWQWTSQGDGPDNGAESTYIDLNRFNGDIVALDELLGEYIPTPLYKIVVNLLPQDATLDEKFSVLALVHEAKETMLQSADDAANLIFFGNADSVVKVWEADRWTESIVGWLHEHGVTNVELWEIPE